MAPPAFRNRRKVWVVIPGGGVRGAFQAGFLEAFFRKHPDLEIDRVYGASVGAIIAPYVASKQFSKIESFFTGIRSITDIFSPWSLIEKFIPQVSLLLRGAAYKRVSIVDDIEKDLIKTPDVYDKCFCVAWDISNRQSLWFTGEAFPLGARASSALPMAVPPIKIQGNYYVDAYVDELVPVSRIPDDLSMCPYAKDVVVLIVDCSTRKMPMHREIDPKSILRLLDCIIADTTLLNSMHTMRVLQRTVDHVYHVKPTLVEFTSAMDFDKDKIRRSLETGRRAGRSFNPAMR